MKITQCDKNLSGSIIVVAGSNVGASSVRTIEAYYLDVDCTKMEEDWSQGPRWKRIGVKAQDERGME